MKKIKKLDALIVPKKKLNVGSYCRVSTDSDGLLHSLANQISWFKQKIKENDEWTYVDVYKDLITGTKETRKDFDRMLDDCRRGKVDMILTKSISRFARNALITLNVTRELRELGIDVYFLENDLHSINPESDFILSCAASMAQEESRSTSEHQKWRVQNEFKKGKIWGMKPFFGYDIENNQYVINEMEAKIIKLIFELYLLGHGDNKISKILNEEGYITFTGKRWGPSSVRQILTNVTYTGNLILQKTYRVDYLSKRKRINKGEKAKYFVENNHPAIIDKDTFEEALQIRKERTPKNCDSIKKSNNELAGKIICGCCLKSYKKVKKNGIERWICRRYLTEGKDHCCSKAIPHKVLIEKINEVLKGRKLIELEFVTIFNDNRMLIKLKEEEAVLKTWALKSRRESWTDEMKEKARQKTLNNLKRRAGDC